MSRIVEIVNPATGEIATFVEGTPEFNAKRDALLLDHEAKKKALEIAKELEMAARKATVAFIFDTSVSGTQNVELGGGYIAKAVIKINYGWRKTADGKIDKKAIEKALLKIEKDGEVGELIAERLVKWTPDLSLTEYKSLSEKHKKIIDDVVETSDGAPTLEIKAPKAPK